jgi:hypothetical protein
MSKEEVLLAKEIFEKTLELIKITLNGATVMLPNEILAKIADDSDWHRTRIGYSKYKSFVLVTIGKKRWAIALGEKYGQYPAAPYNCDLAVIKITGNNVIKIVQEGLGADYFQNSILFAMAKGSLGFMDGSSVARRLFQIFRQESIGKFVGQGLKKSHEFIDPSTLDYLVTEEIKYKESFIPFLKDKIILVLSEQ